MPHYSVPHNRIVVLAHKTPAVIIIYGINFYLYVKKKTRYGIVCDVTESAIASFKAA